MVKDYQKLAQDIVDSLGGKDNINKVVHCATRLRFDIKDETIVNENTLKQRDGVVGIQKSGGQFQVLIGTDVSEVYTEVLKLDVIDGGIEQDTSTKDNSRKKSMIDRFMQMISETMSPYIPVLATAGIISGVISLLQVMEFWIILV